MTLIITSIRESFDVRDRVRVCLLEVIMKATLLLQAEKCGHCVVEMKNVCHIRQKFSVTRCTCTNFVFCFSDVLRKILGPEVTKLFSCSTQLSMKI